ncbi:hypothetical protein F2Q70_00037434 [Brassica cretica]|uniref:Uncharacterized protein n=1 Tax=Brassica cretica TaxID=69181 RepID=A0A8S9JSL9_BRACR|nr:hypothetical protein F2Q70_00037434 [Brassica cretica]
MVSSNDGLCALLVFEVLTEFLRLYSNSLEHGSCLLKLWEVGRWTSMASNLIKMEANGSYSDDFNFGYDRKRKFSQISMMVFGLMKEAASNQGMAVLCFYAQLVLGWEQFLFSSSLQ